MFFYFLENHKDLVLNRCGLCRSTFKGQYQLSVSIFPPGTEHRGNTNYTGISKYTVDFREVKGLATRSVEIILANILRRVNPDGSYALFTVGGSLDVEARNKDYEQLYVYQSDAGLDPLPAPDPSINFQPPDFGLLEALVIFLCKCHELLAGLITNEFGGSDQIRAEFITNASDAGVYHHLGEEKVPKQDLNLIKDKISSPSDWKKKGYKGIENFAPETLEILFNNLESTKKGHKQRLEALRREQEDLNHYAPVFTDDGVLYLLATFPIAKIARATGIRLKAEEYSKYKCGYKNCKSTFMYRTKLNAEK